MKELRKMQILARQLKERGYTMEIIVEGKKIMKIGEGARPGLFGTFGPIEVRDLKTMVSFLGD